MSRTTLQSDHEKQLPLHGTWRRRESLRDARRRADEAPSEPPLCAGCRAHEARYGFRDEGDDPMLDRPRTLCFECFRIEIAYRQAVAARLARGWNAAQVKLPLEETLRKLTHRRRRAQIAARHAVGA